MSRARIAIAFLLIALPSQLAAQGKKGHPVVEPDHGNHVGFSTIACRKDRLGTQPDLERQGQGSRPRRTPAHHRR